MSRKIFTIIFLFLFIKPFILFSEEVISSDSLGTDMKEDLDSLRDPFTPQLPLPPEEEIHKPVAQIPPQPVESLPKSTLIPQPLPKQTIKEYLLKPPVMKISGIIWNSDQPQAIINDQIVKVGDHIEEWTVQKIDQESIEISSRGNKILIPTNFGVGSAPPKATADSNKRSSEGEI